jgi:hypothetical protein
MTSLQYPSSAYRQLVLPLSVVTFCGRYPTACELTSPSSAPDILWCARCDCEAPTTTFRTQVR